MTVCYISRGTVLSEKKEPFTNKIIKLIANSGAKSVFASDTTDTPGVFAFRLRVYPDSSQFTLQVKDMNDRTLKSLICSTRSLTPGYTRPPTLKQYLPIEFKTRQRLSAYSNHGMRG
jgi:hypothetical protein